MDKPWGQEAPNPMSDVIFNELRAWCIEFADTLAVGNANDVCDMLEENQDIMEHERIECMQRELKAKTAECERLRDELRRANEVIDGRINA